MPYRREGDDYVHHQPKSGNGRAMQPSRASSSTETSMPPQYTWLEGLWMAIVSISYLLGYGIQISIIVEKYSLGDDRPPNCGLYIFFFLLPHIMAGLKNLQYHYREAMEEDGEDSSLGWIINIVFLPFSPLIRFVRAWRFGMGEKDNWEDGIRYVDEMVTVGVLRLFEVFLGDGPTLCLLLRDDVWGRSADWSETINGPQNQVRCGPQCSLQPQNPIQFWTVFRMIFLLSKMSQCVTFYIVIVKRLQRLQHPEHFRNQRNTSSRQGRVNLFATLILYTAHFFFIGSRVIGYSMVDTAWGGWVYLIVGAHWLLNTAWHLITLLNSNGITAARSVSSLIMGGVWLITLTNEQGGRQLGRFILYYMLAFFESAICGYLWNIAMAGSGDFFAVKAPWFLLVIYMCGLLAHIVYYALCHPGNAAITKQGLLCCSGDRRDSIDSDEEDKL